MTVSAQTLAFEYAANGVTTTFPYGFRVLYADQVKVYVNGTLQVGGYTLTGVGDAGGGNVVFSIAPINGSTVLVRRISDRVRSTDFQQAPYFTQEELLDIDQDYQTMLLQEAAADGDNSLKIPAEEALETLLPAAELRANKAIVFDALGNVTVSEDDYEDQVAAVAASAAAALASENAAEAAALAASNSEAAADASEAAAAASAAAASASANAAAGTYYVATKAAGNTLAASLLNGATVIVTADESQGGVRVRYTVASGVLGSAVLDTTVMAQFTPAGSGAVATTAQTKLRESISVKDFGAKGDAKFLTDGAISAASSTFTSATAGFTSADAGKVISIFGAGAGGASGASFTTTISAFISSTQVTLAAPASATVIGAVFNYGTDDTAAFNLALAYLAANRINTRGLGRITIPRGRYLCNGTISVVSPLTLIFEGDGVEASQILRTIDTGNLFSFSTYIYLEFANLRIVHSTNGVARASWTNRIFDLNGSGGGREFCLRRVETVNFDRVVNFVGGSGNEDTNYFEGCTFNDFKTFLRSRNSQAVVNKAVQCTWFGYTDRVFDISGFGHTHFDTCNIVQSGTFLYLANGNSGPASQYLATNCKFEFWNGLNANNTLGTTKIVEMENNAANVAYLKFEKCGISGGTPDPAVYQWDLQGGGYTLEVNGGQWGSTLIKTRARTVQGAHNAWWVQFIGCTTSPSRTINRIGGAGGAHHVPVVFDSCVGVENILMRGPAVSVGNGKIAGIAKDRNQNSKNADGYLALGNQTATHSFSSYGQITLVDRIRVAVGTKSLWTGAEIKAFADAGLTIQIGSTITPAGGTSTTPEVHEITVPAGTFTSDGVYVTVKNTNASGGVEGFVLVDTVSI